MNIRTSAFHRLERELALVYDQLITGPVRGIAVLIHGITGNRESMNFLRPILKSNQYNCLRYDLRGRGLAFPLTDPGFRGHLHDLSLILDLASGPCILIGHSFGAEIALRSMHHPNVLGVLALDGGAPASLISRLKTLRMLQEAASRLDIPFTDTESYLEFVAGSPLMGKDMIKSPLVKKFLSYELSRSGRYFVNRMTRATLEAELNALAGSLFPGTLLRMWLSKPWSMFSRMKEYQIDYHKKPIVFLRAMKGNLSDRDQLIPESAIRKIQKLGIPVYDIPLNHYELVTMPKHAQRDLKINQAIRRLEALGTLTPYRK